MDRKSYRQWMEDFSGKCAVYVGDTQGREYLTEDSESEYPTASVIKIYVLGALLRLCQNGEKNLFDSIVCENRENVAGSGIIRLLPEGLRLRVYDLAVLMIIVSDNVATNLLVDYIGGVKIVNDWIADCGLKHTRMNRKTSAKRENELLGVTTPRETARYLAGIYGGELLEESYRSVFLEILEKQQLNEFFTRGLIKVRTAHKTGSFEGARCDVGYVFAEKGVFIFSVFTDNGADREYYPDNEGSVLMGRIGKYCYENFMKK